MKVKPSSLRLLKPFASLNDFFVVIPPHRFIIFGEGKRARYRGIAIEGYLGETLHEAGAYSFDAFLNGSFEKMDAGYDPLAKLDDFDELVSADVITSFALSRLEIKLLRKQDARHFTHVRFYKKPNGTTTARVFDARKYFSGSISAQSVDDYAELDLDTDADRDFYVYVELELLKKLPVDDYDVTVAEDELVSFEGAETGLTFHMRDQRLGEQMEDRISDLGSYDDVFFIDIDRVKPSSADWKNPNAKPRNAKS